MFIELHKASHGFTITVVKLAAQSQQTIQPIFKRVSPPSQEGQAAALFIFQLKDFI